MSRIDVLMTSHNRCAQTIACLESLFEDVVTADLRVVLVDAGSSDGTGEQVAARFPQVMLVAKSPDVFWGGGMQEAGRHARADADFHLWLNDDVVLDGDALSTLVAIGGDDRIVVGKLRDTMGRPTYGGLRARGLKRLSLTPAAVSESTRQVDTMNGNVVLVGKDVVRRIGSVRGDLFPHQFGDVDYGFRAAHAGFEVLQAPDTVGVCSHNPPWRPYAGRTIRARWRAVTGIKALPPRMWLNACVRHGGLLAPAYFALPYLRVLRRDTSEPKA